jgi:hypothetical protein
MDTGFRVTGNKIGDAGEKEKMIRIVAASPPVPAARPRPQPVLGRLPPVPRHSQPSDRSRKRRSWRSPLPPRSPDGAGLPAAACAPAGSHCLRWGGNRRSAAQTGSHHRADPRQGAARRGEPAALSAAARQPESDARPGAQRERRRAQDRPWGNGSFRNRCGRKYQSRATGSGTVATR